MTDTKTAKQILLDAADLIAKPRGWTQEAYARTSPKGDFRNPADADATCFCVMGALYRASGVPTWSVTTPEWSEAIYALQEQTGEICLPRWNDDRKRCKRDVVAALRGAAERVA